MNKNSYLKYIFIFLVFNIFLACSPKNEQKERLIKESVAYFNSKNYPQALIYFEKLISLDSADYASWTARGKTLHLLKRDDEAFKSLDRAISINPEYYEAYSYKATMHDLNEEPELALKDINQALKGNPKDTTLLKIRLGIYLRLKQFDNSINDCNTILNNNPNNPEVLYYRGSAFKKLGKIDKALEDYNSSLNLSPNDPFTLNDRALLLVDQKKYKLAIDDYTHAIQLAGKDDSDIRALAYNNRGFAFFKNGNIPAALKDINYSIELFPANSYAFKNRGLVYLAMKKTDKACSDFEKSEQLGYTKKYGDEILKLREENCK